MTTLGPGDLAYVAGVLDVLASVGTRTAGDALLPMVQVSTRERTVVTHLADLTGMRVVDTRRDYHRHACTEHCADRHQRVVSESARWQVTGAKATIVLAAVAPWLRVKAGPAADAVRLGLDAGRKPATVAAMARLGWPVPPEWR